MKALEYFSILLITIVTFFSLSLIVINTSVLLFIKEIYLILFLLIFAAIALFSVGLNIRLGWMLFSLFFATILINTVYLFISIGIEFSHLFIVISSASLGLLISVNKLSKCTKAKKKKNSNVFVEDILDEPIDTYSVNNSKKSIVTSVNEDDKKVEKKTVKKKSSKKNTAKKKSTKKKVVKKKITKQQPTKAA